jgi:chitinase
VKSVLCFASQLTSSRKDIQICQKIKGKTILFSFGGDSYTEGGFTTPQAAIDAANKVWAMFGPPQDNAYHPYPSQVLRPFGHASFDGFDFDFEGPNLNSIAFAKQLRQLMDDYTKGAGNGRKFYLAAAPQCAYPEIWMKEIMENAYLDLIFVQFYNNYCAGKYLPVQQNKIFLMSELKAVDVQC